MAAPPWLIRRLVALGMSEAQAEAAAAEGDLAAVVADHTENETEHGGGGEPSVPLHRFDLVFENALL